MSERADYPAGAPCWVDVLRPDQETTAKLWAELFGWELEERPGSDAGSPYYVGRLGGRESGRRPVRARPARPVASAHHLKRAGAPARA